MGWNFFKNSVLTGAKNQMSSIKFLKKGCSSFRTILQHISLKFKLLLSSTFSYFKALLTKKYLFQVTFKKITCAKREKITLQCPFV